ncbi:hypothetical protein SCP_0101480 [Sparassis crispa]|uniref:54S ribosomal protein L11, mitochondrial n=1 Tax=Sparassis crispa TaxID=139825 RepID=A0A401G534_9APHY|nr:hypothetical protein SCP_0101480 [Sparassis crispa]GBE77275.1 hypothetical protein SCP_0101480 [Sparassis crispa]
MSARSILARPPRIPIQSFARRAYSVSLQPSLVYPHKSVPRVYSERKTYLYNQYTRLLQSTKTSPLILLQHTDFSVNRLIHLRREIAAAATKHASTAPSLSGPSPTPVHAPELPTLTFMRTSLFGIALRDFAPMDEQISKEIAQLVTGGFTVLSFPTLNPPLLSAILKAMSKAVPPRKPKTEEELEQERKDKEAAFVPGRRPKRVRLPPTPELKVVGALIEGRVFKAEGVQTVAGLPTLDTLRAQLVGLLSAPATQLAMVLSEASGGKLARTLEGLKKSLEEAEKQDAQSASP